MVYRANEKTPATLSGSKTIHRHATHPQQHDEPRRYSIAERLQDLVVKVEQQVEERHDVLCEVALRPRRHATQTKRHLVTNMCTYKGYVGML